MPGEAEPTEPTGTVLVCDACWTKACADGVLMCEEAYTAGFATVPLDAKPVDIDVGEAPHG